MIEMLPEENGDDKTFIIRGTKALKIRKVKKQSEDLESLYIYHKEDKAKESIGIIKTNGGIKMKVLSEEGAKGIKIETTKAAQIGSVELGNRIVFFVTEKER